MFHSCYTQTPWVMFSVIYGGYARYDIRKKDFLKIFNKKHQVKIKDSEHTLTFQNFRRPLPNLKVLIGSNYLAGMKI